jgi:hypothetical protein
MFNRGWAEPACLLPTLHVSVHRERGFFRGTKEEYAGNRFSDGGLRNVSRGLEHYLALTQALN